jgi:uncharacterized protein
MGLSGEQKRTARKKASAARTTRRTTGRKATRTASATPAATATAARGTKRTLKKTASRGSNGTAATLARRTAKNGASAKKGAVTKAHTKASKAAVPATKALKASARNGATNGAGAVDYLNPSTIERRKSKINGWGVFALQDIPKNKRIVSYAGERISAKESGPREERYLEKGHIWCFQLNRAWVIDAAIGGNIARFVNHACKPNCYTHIVDGTIWIRAGKPIRKGEELTYNYYTEGQAEIPCKCVPGCQGML